MSMKSEHGGHTREMDKDTGETTFVDTGETTVVDLGPYEDAAERLKSNAEAGDSSMFIQGQGDQKGLHTPNASELYISEQELAQRKAAKEVARSIAEPKMAPAPRVDSNPTRAFSLDEIAAMKASMEEEEEEKVAKKPWWKIW